MEIRSISISAIVEGYSPRRNLERKEELKKSIEREGLLEPLLVRKDGSVYVIIDGNRRFRVVKELGFQEADCMIIDADEKESYRLSYIKNTQRENFNPIEESLHIQAVKNKFGYNNEELVRQGYAPHRSTIDDKLRLLALPEDIQEQIIEGRLDPSKGYELGKLKDEKSQRELFHEIFEKGDIAVRPLKDMVRSLNVRRRREEKKALPQVEIPQGDIPGVFFKDSSDMSELADGSAGLIVTSPPYGVGMEYEEDISFEDHLDMLRNVLSECVRVLIPGGKICINVGDIHNFGTRNGGKPEIELIGHHIQDILRKGKVRLIDIITWKKGLNWFNNPQVTYHQKAKHTSYRILNNTEYIYVFVKDGEREVPFDIEHESKISKDEWKEWVDGVWEIPPVRRQEGHPAQFPEEIPRRLIRMYSYKGDIVLDCFGGSMTTVKVANELGRIGIGYEKEEKYKPVIMEKLGLTEKNLKKPEVDEDGDTQEGDPHFINQFQGVITDILAENSKTTKDIVSVRVPFSSSAVKDDIEIDWVKEDDETDPPGSTSSLQLKKADDYGKEKALRQVA